MFGKAREALTLVQGPISDPIKQSKYLRLTGSSTFWDNNGDMHNIGRYTVLTIIIVSSWIIK